MKKFASLFLCAAFLLLFGCGQNNNGGDAISSASSVSSEIISSSSAPTSSYDSSTASTVSNAPLQPVKTVTVRAAQRLNINYNVDDIKALLNGNLVFETSKRSGEQTIYSYNLKNQCASPIGTVQFFYKDSADFVIMKNNSCMYYCPLLFDKQGNNALIKVNFANKKVTYEKRFNLSYSPFVFFNRINDTEFLMDDGVILPVKESGNNSDNIWEYYIKKYNVDTKKETVVVKNRFDKNTQSGTLTASICLKDNMIYSYSIKGTAGKTEGVIEVYDLNGKLQKAMQIPQLESTLKANKDDIVFSMKTFGNYFYFNTLHNLNLFYEYTGSELKKVDLGNYPYMSIIEHKNVTNDQTHNRMIYFTESDNNQETAIGILDSTTGTFKNAKIVADDGFQYIYRAVVDEKGNIVADMCKQKDTGSKNAEHRYYYIEAQKLLNAQ